MKILVLDDELAALETFLPAVIDNDAIDCKMFKDDPGAALEYVKKEQVTAAVLDVRMPGADGIALAEKMVAARSSLKIIIITAYTQDEDEIKRRLGGNFAGLLYKPYDLPALKATLATLAAPQIFLRTFGAFDLFVNGAAVRFNSSKAKELLALLTEANGGYVSMDTAIDCLWANKDPDHGKRLYRDAVCRLRLTLQKYGVENLVSFERARAVINVQAAECDLWSLLKNGGSFSGRYMSQYEWSIITEAMLQNKFGD